MRATDIAGGDVVLERRRRASEVETDITVVPSSVALHGELARVSVVNEALLRVAESDVVLQNMVRRRVVGNTELEAISVAIEFLEVPAVEAVAPGVDLLQGNGRAEHEKIEAVIDVVPQASIAEDIAFARAFLAGKSIRALSILARIAIAVRVKVDDCVVRGSTLELEACLIVVMGGDELVVVVRGVSGIDAVRSVDQPGLELVLSAPAGLKLYVLKVVELPVVTLLDMESAPLLVRQGLIQTIGRPNMAIRKADSRQRACELVRTREVPLRR